MISLLSSMDLLFLIYVFTFGLSGLICFLIIPRINMIDDLETRKGLFYLILSSGIWAISFVGYLLVPGEVFKLVFYMIGLIFGLFAVGAWLYFCSAYTNRVLHRNKAIRWIALLVFLVLVLFKVTNPIHEMYFTSEMVNTPFTYLKINHGIVHWLSMGLSYGLSMVGYFMLVERFVDVSYDRAKPLIILVIITALPLIFDIVGLLSPYFIDIPYESIGVTIFGVGVLSVFFDSFQTLKVAGEHKEPIIVVDDQDRIKEYNESAQRIFPELKGEGVVGSSLEEVSPEIAEVLDSGTSIIEKEIEGETRYYQVTESPFSARQEQLGRVIVFDDVTERREAEKREEFLHSLLRHDLRNQLQVSLGYGELLKEEDLSEEQEEILGKDWKSKKKALDLIKKVSKLRKANEEEPEEVELNPILQSSVDKYRPEASQRDMKITVEKTNATVKAGSFLDELLSNIVINSVIHSKGSEVRVQVDESKEHVVISVEDDGKGIPDEDKDKIFEKRFKSDETGGTGMGLYLVKQIAKSYGGNIEVKDSDLGGARFDIYLEKP